jgi:hypothetical protein
MLFGAVISWRKRFCVPGSDELFEIRPRSMCFGCWVNLCCNCEIPEVPTRIIHVQPMLEALEGSGKA